MTPAAIAALCGFAFSPPPTYDLSEPPGLIVVQLAFADLQRLPASICDPTRLRYGCADRERPILYLPTWKTWPGTRACYDENKRHELAHLKGWVHP